jgi:DNA-binding Lrp family transcriptional regulator
VTASERDPREIAARLGISESAVRRLQARGILRQFDLGADEVRLRLWLGHQLDVQRLVMGQAARRSEASATDSSYT